MGIIDDRLRQNFPGEISETTDEVAEAEFGNREALARKKMMDKLETEDDFVVRVWVATERCTLEV